MVSSRNKVLSCFHWPQRLFYIPRWITVFSASCNSISKKPLLEDIFQSIQIPAPLLPQIIDYIQSIHKSEKGFHHSAIDELHAEIKLIDDQMDKLTDLLINDNIHKEAYNRKFEQLQSRRQDISMLQEEHHGDNEQFKTALTTMVLLSSKALETFKSSKTQLSRQLISLVFSNLELSGGNLQYTLREPFESFTNLESYQKWLVAGAIFTA